MHTISELKRIVDKELASLVFNTQPRDLYEPISYMLSLDAKRMRPVLLLSACELFKGDIHNAMMPALGIEVFHNFTLLHDDIMDNAPLRRSKQTVHAKWNSNVAILSGDTMFVKACQLMMMVDNKVLREVMELFHATAIEVCEGQQLDMDFELSAKVSIDDYIHMITNKTAVLLGAALKTGAILASATHADANHIYEFGKDIGIAFQLKDDILDVFGDDTKFGKMRGGDIVANKKTFLWLKAFELAKDDTASLLKEWANVKTADPTKKVEAIKQIYEELNILHLAEAEMEKYFNEALHHLNEIKANEVQKSVLRGFAESLMVREA